MFLGCFFQDCLQIPVGIHLLFPVLANPWLLKLNLIWEIVKIILIPEGATMEVCHSNLLLLGAQLTNGPSFRPLGCTALTPFGFQTMTAWRGMKAGRPFPTRHGTQDSPSAWLNISQNCCGQDSSHLGLLSFFSPSTHVRSPIQSQDSSCFPCFHLFLAHLASFWHLLSRSSP